MNGILTADWCSAQVRFYAPRNELWTTCTDNGFLVLRFTNGAYPLPPLAARSIPSTTSEATEISATPDVERSTKMNVSGAGPPTVSTERLRLAYACIIVPQVDERSLKTSDMRRPPGSEGRRTVCSLCARLEHLCDVSSEDKAGSG